jgi:hypothetical protein
LLRAATHGRGLYETILASQPAVPILSKAVSRKTHGTAGVFDVNLPLTGSPGIEDRTGGADGAGKYKVVLTFTTPITAGNATVTSGTGSVSGVSFEGMNMIVSLSGVANAQKLTITATGVSNSTGVLASVPVTLEFLIGDTNSDGAVNSGDATQARNNSGRTTDATNFRTDVNADGVTNSGDAFIVRSRSGSAIP